ncbi:MAG: putative peptidoglycan-binding domain-containing protein [Acidobacteriaceae bacterium]
MADVDTAIKYVLGFEDSTLSGRITVDAGGRTRFGIAEKFHPELQNSLFYTSMGSEAALKIAQSIYRREYADPLWIDHMSNQNIANKMTSLAVNVGVHRASVWLQSVLKVQGDGRIGPLTLMALADADPLIVLADLKAQAEQFYISDVQKHPEFEEYLNGWLARARA